MDIKGASVIVTGAASGLGNATARSFADKGATVFGLDLQASIDKAVEQGIDEGITLIAADVTSESDVQAAIARATEAAPLRVVVNCAGIAPAARIVSKRGVHALDLFETCISVNLVGTFNVLRLAAEAMSTQDTVDGVRTPSTRTASAASSSTPPPSPPTRARSARSRTPPRRVASTRWASVPRVTSRSSASASTPSPRAPSRPRCSRA